MAKKDIIKRKKGEVIYDAKIEGQDIKFKNYKLILAAVLFSIVLLILIFD